jgi:DNA-binding protein H-NS
VIVVEFPDGRNGTMALKTMSVEKLRDLRSKVESAIGAKVAERRRELESELSKLMRVDGSPRGGKTGRGGQRGPVAPKYRNPENPAETWSGRGLPPRWMAAQLKGGKKREDFLIAGGSKASAAKTQKKTRKAGKVKARK